MFDLYVWIHGRWTWFGSSSRREVAESVAARYETYVIVDMDEGVVPWGRMRAALV